MPTSGRGRLPPGPTSIVPGRLALAFARNRLHFLRDLTARYGDVVFFRLGGLPYAILNHPEYMRDVLVTRGRSFHKGLGLQRARLLLGDGLLTSEDERHARQRRLVQPAFHRDSIAAYGQTMVACAERRAAAWMPGATLDVAHEMAGITLAIAGQSLFDADIEQDATRIRDSLTEALASFNVALLPFGDVFFRLPIPAAQRFRRARRALDETIYRLIAERRAAGAAGRDLLSMLVAARDDDQDGSGMTDEQVRDEVLTLLLAGHETTANALAWAWYLVSLDAGVERTLHDEVDRALGGREPTVADLPDLPYTRAVLAESMRLFPPAYLVGRRALAAYDVPGTDYVLPPQTVIFLSQYLLHRDARFWDEPDRFDPARWLAEESRGAPRIRYAYFPFGAGPRICVGEQFAWMEGVLVLASIARRWRFRLAQRHPVEPQAIVTLRPRKGLRMVAFERL